MRVLDIISEAKTPKMSPQDQAMAAAIQDWIKKHPDAFAEMQKDANSKIGITGMGILRFLGIAIPAVRFAYDMRVLDALAMEKLPSGEFAHTKAEIEATRNAMWGMFVIAEGAVFLPKLVGSIPIVSGFLKLLLGAVAAVAGAKGAGAVAVSFNMLTQVAITACATWLSTDAGKEWLADSLVKQMLVQDVGAAVGNTWRFLYHKFFEVSGIREPNDPVHNRVDDPSKNPNAVGDIDATSMSDKEYTDRAQSDQRARDSLLNKI